MAMANHPCQHDNNDATSTTCHLQESSDDDTIDDTAYTCTCTTEMTLMAV
jgi:hypothetical protein